MLTWDASEHEPRASREYIEDDTPAPVLPPVSPAVRTLAWQAGMDATRWLEYQGTGLRYARPSQYRRVQVRRPVPVVSLREWERAKMPWWRRIWRRGR